jgi:hypothetical protein
VERGAWLCRFQALIIIEMDKEKISECPSPFIGEGVRMRPNLVENEKEYIDYK